LVDRPEQQPRAGQPTQPGSQLTGSANNTAVLNRRIRSGYLVTNPASRNTQNPTSPATIARVAGFCAK
jgi:hypothetical protein